MRRVWAAAIAGAAVLAMAAAPQGGRPKAVKVKQATANFEFSYEYPAAVAAQPALARALNADLARQRRELADGARAARADAKGSTYPFMAYGFSATWQVVTELPGWLSLSENFWSFSGGAHGNPGFDSLLWDKAQQKRRAMLDLFTSKAALSTAIRAPFCAALNAQRAEKRGSPVDPSSTSEFDTCIDPVAEVLILGSTDHRHFDRLGILIAPYEAGPYAEGEYEVSLPVTPAVIAAVEPQYRALFGIGKSAKAAR